MSQQINLLRDGLEGRKVPWSARKLGVLVLISLVLLALWSLLVQRQLSAIKAENALLKSQLDAGSIDVQTLAKAIQARAPSSSLPQEIDQARVELEGRRWLLSTLRGEALDGRSEPLSPYLEGLGRQRVDALWLTQIAIDEGGAQFGLRGRLLDPSALPAYLDRLGDEAAFAGREFRLFVLSRPVPSKDEPTLPGIDFSVATGCAAEGLKAICDEATERAAP